MPGYNATRRGICEYCESVPMYVCAFVDGEVNVSEKVRRTACITRNKIKRVYIV